MLNKRQQYIFVLSIPIINVVADSTQDYFEAGLASLGYIRALIILFFLSIYFKDFYRKNTLNNLIIVSLGYFFILGFFSSNLLYSQAVFLKYLIGLMMFPVGYYYIRTKGQYQGFLRTMYHVTCIYVFFLIISNIFSLGSSDYLEESVYFGAGRVNMTKSLVLLVLMFPLLLDYDKRKKINILPLLIMVIAVIFILLGVKRSALLSLFIGFFVYYSIAPVKTRVTKGLFVFALILLLTSPLYFKSLEQRFITRQEAGRFDYSKAEEEEGRVIELQQVLDAFTEGNLGYKLFGAEFLNSMTLFQTKRMLHTDYATILAGAGVLGLLLFFSIYYLIYKKSYYLFKAFRSDLEKKNIMAVSISLLIAMLISGIGGTVTEIGIRSLAFLFWGASFSYLEHELNGIKYERLYPDISTR